LAYVEISEEEGRSRWAGAAQAIRYELCQAMREVLLGHDLPALVSKRAAKDLEELRADFPWLEAGKTALVRDAKGDVRWWTFCGLHANAALAARLVNTHGFVATPNNLAIRIVKPESLAAVDASVRALRQTPVEDVPAPVSDKALQGLKFVECLPADLARRVLQMRTTDVQAITAVKMEPVVIAG
jgi:ATP-dependent helicase Lhr and Lhr-like helicase